MLRAIYSDGEKKKVTGQLSKMQKITNPGDNGEISFGTNEQSLAEHAGLDNEALSGLLMESITEKHELNWINDKKEKQKEEDFLNEWR